MLDSFLFTDLSTIPRMYNYAHALVIVRALSVSINFLETHRDAPLDSYHTKEWDIRKGSLSRCRLINLLIPER